MQNTLDNIRHERSKKDFPFLSLEDKEYVELAITRTKIGIISIWFTSIICILLLILGLIFLTFNMDSASQIFGINSSASGFLIMIFFILVVLVLLIAIVCVKVYAGNKLFVTNKRVIQITTTGLFNNSTNVVELSRIEDVSFKQNGFLQSLFRYGTIRLSTVGDETTYTFPFVDTPTDEMETIAHLVHIQKKK